MQLRYRLRTIQQNISETREAVTRMREANIPLEVMWNDIDYMNAYRKWVAGYKRALYIANH